MKILVTDHYIRLAKKTRSGCPLTLLLRDLLPNVNTIVGTYHVFLNSISFKLLPFAVGSLAMCRRGESVVAFDVILDSEEHLVFNSICSHERTCWASDPKVDVHHIYERCMICGLTIDIEERKIEG